MTWQPEVDEIAWRRQLALRMGGEERIKDQHDRGKLTVRERIDALIDENSFREQFPLAGSAAYKDGKLEDFVARRTVFGRAKLDGRPVVITADDYTARPASGSAGVPARGGGGGSMPRYGSGDHMALALKLPLVRLVDGFGADIRGTQGTGATHIPIFMWDTITAMLQEVPLIAVALGAIAGAPAALMAGCHFSVMVKGVSQVFAAGPPVVKRSLYLDISKEDLGGYKIHARGSGLIDNEAEDEYDAFRQVKRFLSYLPTNVHQMPPVHDCVDDSPDRREPSLIDFMPRDRFKPYDPRKLVNLIVDKGSAFEIGRYYGRSQVTMFARINGKPVGVLANDPVHHGGGMEATAARKLEKFVDLCDTFHLPVVNFADQPGFVVGPVSESAGTLKEGARALTAIEQATIPWCTVIVRRLYGVAGQSHQAHTRWVYRFAWPSAEWGSIPIEGGIAAAYRREIENSADPEARQKELEAQLAQIRGAPFRTAEISGVEDIVDPRETRPMLCEWVDLVYDQIVPQDLGKKLRGTRP
jgi:acetyl-CoA carboxylase carboxyltransferase component